MHMFKSPCFSHCIDLIMGDIGKVYFVKEVVKEDKVITLSCFATNFIYVQSSSIVSWGSRVCLFMMSCMLMDLARNVRCILL